VARIEHGDTAGKIDVFAALRIPEARILRARGMDRRGGCNTARHRLRAADE
jgi:hypothetical protein